MIVSHQHQFIYLRSRKTGSTSTEIALAAVVGDDAVVTPIDGKDKWPKWRGYRPRNFAGVRAHAKDGNHLMAGEVRERLGNQLWDSYFKFAVDRNPWDKAVSLFFANTHRTGPRPFAEWLRWIPSFRLTNYPNYTIDGAVAVNQLIRYESLGEHLAMVRERVGLPPLALPRANGAFRPDESRDYRSLYDDDSAMFIADLCAREIALFDYRFDDCGT